MRRPVSLYLVLSFYLSLVVCECVCVCVYMFECVSVCVMDGWTGEMLSKKNANTSRIVCVILAQGGHPNII